MRPGRAWATNGILLVVVALIVYFGLTSLFHKASAHAAVRTATVTTGTVQETVTASGNLSPAQSETVNFATGGTVTAIDASVGQVVTPGQQLAQLDPGPAQAALTAAQDDLSAAQDNLALAQSGGETPPQQAQDAAAQAADQAAVATAQQNLASAQARLASDEAACSASAGTAAKASPSPSAGASSTASASTPCSQETADQATVDQDQAALTSAQNTLEQENLSVAAKRYVNPATVLQDQGAVAQAQEAVSQDQKALTETTLQAPIGGTITAVNGTVGQSVSGGGVSAAATSASSGSATSGSVSGGAGSTTGAASSSSSSASTSSGFMTIADLSDLQVVAGFPEADAVKVKVGQPATASLSAVPGTTIAGTVTAVSPTPAVVSNVVTYDVTVSLTNLPAAAHNGMSVSVAVVVSSASNTLMLPSSAVTTTGSISTVTVLHPDGRQSVTTVTTGLVGDTDTQILSGLSAGERVVEPTVTVTGAGSTTRTGTGTGFGGLGGGFGGGGFGGGFGGGGSATGSRG